MASEKELQCSLQESQANPGPRTKDAGIVLKTMEEERKNWRRGDHPMTCSYLLA